MKKSKIDLKKLFEPKDIVPILAVIIGIVVAISYNELEIRLIGVCIFILGGVPLFINITSKLPSLFEIRLKPSQTKEYEINVIKQSGATRFVINDPDLLNNQDEFEKNDKSINTTQQITGDEGFIVVKEKQQRKEQIHTIDNSKDLESVMPNTNLDFSDIDSEVKIVGTFKGQEQYKPYHKGALPTDKQKHEETSSINSPDKLQIRHNLEEEKPADSLRTNAKVTLEQNKITGTGREIKTTIVSKQKENEAKDHTYPQPNINVSTKNYIEKAIDVPINLLMESEPIIIAEPKKEFEQFLHRILEAIRSIINAKTAIFFLVNFEKKELILQAYSSEIKEAIVKKRKIPLGNDIVSQIVNNSKPEILTEINSDAEIDLLPYYTVQTNTQSFIGMPVFYKKSTIGILCSDSTLSDAYDSVTVNFLSQFTKLISALVHSYTEKFDLLQSSKTLNAINNLRELAYNRDVGIEDIYRAITEILKSIFDFQQIGTCSYNNHNGSWYISSYYTTFSDKNYEGLEIDPTEALIGESILSYKTVSISPLPKGKKRVMNNETDYETGFFVSVPLKSCSYNYGALFIEGNNPSSCTGNDIRMLETIGETAGSIIEQLFYADAVSMREMFESQSGILSTNSFLNRLNQELNRATDYQTSICLCQLRIDKYATYFEEMFREKSDLIYHHIINILRKFLRQYDVFGKTDDNTFGVILIGMNLNQSQLWAERLRAEIAKTFLMIKTKRYNATISAGIAEANNMSSVEELLANSNRALDIACQKSNKVVIYQ